MNLFDILKLNLLIHSKPLFVVIYFVVERVVANRSSHLVLALNKQRIRDRPRKNGQTERQTERQTDGQTDRNNLVLIFEDLQYKIERFET